MAEVASKARGSSEFQSMVALDKLSPRSYCIIILVHRNSKENIPMKSSRSRLNFDVVLIASIMALSFLPVVGSEAAKSLRIIAGIYTLFLVLANTILGRRARLIMDLSFALFLASMAWFEI